MPKTTFQQIRNNEAVDVDFCLLRESNAVVKEFFIKEFPFNTSVKTLDLSFTSINDDTFDGIVDGIIARDVNRKKVNDDGILNSLNLDATRITGQSLGKLQKLITSKVVSQIYMWCKLPNVFSKAQLAELNKLAADNRISFVNSNPNSRQMSPFFFQPQPTTVPTKFEELKENPSHDLNQSLLKPINGK